MIGTRVGEYLIEEKLGHGGMGSVYMALDTVLHRPVALKFILSDFNDHPEMAKRFLAEAQVLASLSCVHIPILYGYLIWEGKGVMAMEYVNGETLESLVLKRGPIPADICVPYIKQALKGLAAAHENQVVHRDLKPSNLMLNRQGVVKVVDFGIAKKLQDEAGLTGTNTTVGTPYYMAPEQIQKGLVTPQSDVYSMGVVLYQLLAGQVPFQGSVFDIQTSHVQSVPEPPTLHYPYIPKDVVAAVMKALEKRPKDRFKDAQEFLEALPDLQPAIREVSSPVREEPRPEQRGSGGVPPGGRATPDKDVFDVTAPHPVVDRGAAERSGDGTGGSKKLLLGVAAVAVLAVGGVTWSLLERSKGAAPPPRAATESQTMADVASAPSATTPDETPFVPSPKPGRAPAKPSAPADHAGTSGAKNVRPTVPKTGSTTPDEPPPIVRVSQDLSGSWQGVYMDSSSPQDRTVVTMQMQQGQGGLMTGTVNFQKADHTSGTCSLSNSAYYADRKRLKILMHCSDPRSVPKYFNTPTWLAVADPSEAALSGKIDYFPTVTVAIRRSRP